jgi:hypothetical protein
MPNTTYIERATAQPLVLVTDYNYDKAIKLVTEASPAVTRNEQQCQSSNQRPN